MLPAQDAAPLLRLPSDLRGLEIDDQLEPRRLLDRQIGRLRALEDPSDAIADLGNDSDVVNPIADQGTAFRDAETGQGDFITQLA
jgi:hypothetical protein